MLPSGIIMAVNQTDKTRRLRLDMTAFVDVAFLLLTFFIMTTTFGSPSRLPVDLPMGNRSAEDAQLGRVVVSLAGPNQLEVFYNPDASGNRRLTTHTMRELKELKSDLIAVQKADSAFSLQLRVDQSVAYATVDSLIGLFRECNIKRFHLLTRQP